MGASVRTGRMPRTPELKLKSSRLWMLALAVGVGCGPAKGGPPAKAPRAGVVKEEIALLKREYGWKEGECNRTAEDVVDMQRRCSETRWPECVSAAVMYHSGCGVAQDVALAESLYQRSCDFGSALGCVLVAITTQDTERSIVLLEKPCAQGNSE